MTVDANPTDGSTGTSVGDTAFTPGRHIGLVAERTIGLIARENASTREKLWSLVSVDASLDDVLDELSRDGIKQLPDFGVARVEDDLVRIVTRGRVIVTVRSIDGSERVIDPSSVRTWIEEAASDVALVSLTLSDGEPAVAGLNDEGGFFVRAGSIPAAALQRRFADGAEPVAGDDAGSGPGGTDDASPSEGSDDASSAAAADEERTDESEAGPDDAETAGDDRSTDAGADEPRAEGSDADEPIETETSGEAEVDSDTITETERVHDKGSNADPDVDAVIAGLEASLASDDADSVDESPDQPNGLDQTNDDEHADGGEQGDVDDHAVPDAGTERASGSEPAAPVIGLFDAEEPDEPRAVQAVLVFGNGERIPVDRAVLIGRNPKITGVVDAELPRIMKFDGPGHGLSRTHAEVRVHDGDLVVEDLQSTNGTEVQRPGELSERIESGVPTAISYGTTIVFGDELTCQVEAPPRD